MKKRGFTLIELLAVLVILAVIILIAFPIISKTIHESKVGAALDAGYGYVRAVEASAANDAMSHPGHTYTGTYTISGKKIINTTNSTDTLTVSYHGSAPTGTLVMSKRTVKSATLVINGFNITYDGKTMKENK